MLFKRSLGAGFTVTEILLVVAIVGLLAGVVINSTLNFRRGAVLNTETERVVAILNQARTQTLSSLNGLAYGVYFSSTTATIFSGSTYVAGSTGEEVFTLDPQVIISSLNLNGGSQVAFARLSGRANVVGSLTLAAAASTTQTRTIIISQSGVVSSK